MIIFTILFMVLGILLFGGILLLSVGGGVLTIFAADIIVCAVLIGLLIRFLWKRRRK